MQVNLRKANALAKALQDEAHKQTAPTSVSISVYAENPDIAGAVKTAGDAVRTALADALALSTAAYTLRGLMGKAFHTSGINDLLTEKALLDKREKLISQVVATAPTGPQAEQELELAPRRLASLIEQRAAAAGSPNVSLRSLGESLTVQVPPSAYAGLDDELREIRRRKTEISDELLGLNAANRVTIPEDVAALIERFKLN